MDLTIAEIIAQLPANDAVKTWWENAAALPQEAGTNEFFAKTLKAASDAQRLKNTNAPVGSRIDGYPAPTNSPVTVDATSGLQTFVATYSVRSRVAVNLDVAISPLV